MHRRHAVITALLALLVPHASAMAQTSRPLATRAGFWVASAIVVGAAAAGDARIRSAVRGPRSAGLDRLGDAANVLGTGNSLTAAMVVAYGAARLTSHPAAASAVLRTAAGYTAGNVVESALKPIVGRHRPPGSTGPHEFRPFSLGGDWHSFPSAHEIHAITIATGIAEENDAAWPGAVAFGGAALVGWSRLYRDQHWASDVAAAGVLGVASADATIRWLKRRQTSR
jgi:membrane-associated phospholipid phosphatase